MTIPFIYTKHATIDLAIKVDLSVFLNASVNVKPRSIIIQLFIVKPYF